MGRAFFKLMQSSFGLQNDPRKNMTEMFPHLNAHYAQLKLPPNFEDDEAKFQFVKENKTL